MTKKRGCASAQASLVQFINLLNLNWFRYLQIKPPRGGYLSQRRFIYFSSIKSEILSQLLGKSIIDEKNI